MLNVVSVRVGTKFDPIYVGRALALGFSSATEGAHDRQD